MIPKSYLQEWIAQAGDFDAVNYNSGAYSAGQVAGGVVNVALQNLTPCKLVGVARQDLRAIHGIQSASHAVNAGGGVRGRRRGHRVGRVDGGEGEF